MELVNSTTSQNGGKKMELVLKCGIDVSKKTIKEMAEHLHLSWVNPRVDDRDYPFLDSFLGKWSVEVLRLQKKLKFPDIVRSIKKDGWQPASVHHLLALMSSQEGQDLTGSFMAPGSMCIDDFEYPGCVVLSINGEDKKLGLGNWRGSKIGNYDVVRVRLLQQAPSLSDEVAY
jgi:hypothetical protein